jgi:hypothetical protein
MALRERIVGFGSEDCELTIPLLTDSKNNTGPATKPDDKILTVDEVSELPTGAFLSRLSNISTYHERVRRQRVREDIKVICEGAQFHGRAFLDEVVAYWVKCLQTNAPNMDAICINVYTGLDEKHSTSIDCLKDFTKLIADYKSKVSEHDWHFVRSAVMDDFVKFLKIALGEFGTITKIPRYLISDIKTHGHHNENSSAGFCCREFPTTFKIYVWWRPSDMQFILK